MLYLKLLFEGIFSGACRLAVSPLPLLLVIQLFVISSSHAQQCSAVFPDVAQSHSSNGRIKFKNNASIVDNGDQTLHFDNLLVDRSVSAAHQTCVTVACTINHMATSSLSLAAYMPTTETTALVYTGTSIDTGTVSHWDFKNDKNPKKNDLPTYHIQNSIGANENQRHTLGPGEDQNLSEVGFLYVQGNTKLTLSAGGSPFKARAVMLSGDARVHLNAGEYWFEEFGMEDGAQLTVTGPVTIYVSGHLDIVDNSQLNMADGSVPTDLAIVAYDVAHFKEGTELKAVVYADGDARLEGDAKLTGAIASNNLELKNDARLQFSSVSGVNIGDLCQDVVTPPTVDHYRISHDGTGSTCASESVTIKACADSACSTLSEGAVTLNLKVADTSYPVASFTGETSVSFRHTSAADVSLSVINASFAAANAMQCANSGNNDASCTMTFSSDNCLGGSCPSAFPDVAQSFHADGELKFKEEGVIMVSPANTSLELMFPNLTLDSSGKDRVHPNHNTCSTGRCTISNQTSLALELPSFQTTASLETLTVNNEIATLGRGGDYSYDELLSLTVEGNTELTLTPPLRVKAVNVFGEGKLILTPGEYWFENFSMSGDAKLEVTGAVTIYVKEHMDIVDNSEVNIAGDAHNLLFINYAQSHFKNQTQTQAVIYAITDFHLDHQATLTGAVASKKVEIKGNAVLTYADVSSVNVGDMCDEPPYHHLEIIHDGEGHTCLAESVTIKACADSSCSSLHQTPLSLDFQVDGVTYNQVSFTGSTLLEFNYTTAETVTLGLANMSEQGASPFVCVNGSDTSCDMAFSATGMVLSVNDGPACGVQNGTLRALTQSGSEEGCVAALSGDHDVEFKFQYQAPDVGSRMPRLAGSDLADAGKKKNLTVTFDDNGVATLPWSYADAGELWFSATVGKGKNAVTATDTAVFYPAQLALTATNSSGQALNATTASGTPVQIAAANFNLDINAQCSDGTVTPNYQPVSASAIALFVDRTGPVGAGTVNGNFKANSSAITISAVETPAWTAVDLSGNFSNGVYSSNSASYSEVGLLNLDVRDNNYMGHSIPSAGAINIGRFVADHFSLDSSSVSVACGSFSYLDQPFDSSYSLSARNADNQVTQNYFGSFGGATLAYKAEDEAAGLELSSRLSLSPTAIWEGGVLVENDLSMNLARLAGADGPYTAVNLGIAVLDNDSGVVIPLAAMDMNASTTNNCTVADNCTAKKINSSALHFRFGRGQLFNSFGSELQDLGVKFEAQYWDGQRFSWNSLDSCSLYRSSDSQLTNEQKGLAEGDVSVLTPTTNAIVVSGTGTVLLQSPGTGKQGQLDVEVTVPDWLMIYNQANSLYDVLPSATVAFGQFRGNDRVINWREVQ